MKTKHLFLTAILLVFSVLVVAGPVDPTRALKVAEQFAPQPTKAKRIKSKTTPEQSYEIVYTHRMPNSDRAAFYVVKLGEKGFVIISADDVANPILGYSYTNSWPTSISAEGDTILPPQVLSYLNDMALQIETAIEKYPNLESSEEWNNVGKKAVRKISARRSADALPDSVGPLLTTTWGQGQYYNALCPEDANGEDGHVPTGCVATAMAQIINYWGQKEEIKTRGIHSYDSPYGKLTVNYDSTSYDFANMPNALTAESTPKQINAVAKLMYECGVAVNMQYSAGESGSLNQDARAALINFYYFNPDLSIAERAYFSSKDWDKLLQSNIANNQPIYYAGQDISNGGHAFVCDGYNATGYYHFNFGWGGWADGWYLTSAVSPIGMDFSNEQLVLVGIVPDNTSNVILGQTAGTSTFTVDEPLEFYHLLGHNAYEGTNYINGCNNHVLFQSADDATQLVLDILEHEDQNAIVYEGDGGTELRSLYAGQENDLSPVVSTNNALHINYSGNLYYSGFRFAISKDEGCRRVSNVVTLVDTTTVHLMWQENGNATQWEIEYGEKGFALGSGTRVVAKATQYDLIGLKKLTEYDIYIRSVCGQKEYGGWSKVSILSLAPYWTDVVTEQPDGYVVSEDYTRVYISTPEAFAWWAKQECSIDAYLMADLDMSAYRWKPTDLSCDLFGQGYCISGLYIREATNHIGLFSELYGSSSIVDVGLTNSRIESVGSSYRVGGFCGVTYNGIIRNCFVSNSVIIGGNFTGGLIGSSNNAIISNSYVNSHVSGKSWSGLLIGELTSGTIQNCYAAGKFEQRSYCYSYNGGIVAYANSGVIDNCYSIDVSMGIVGFGGTTNISDTSTIISSPQGYILETPIIFDEEEITDLLDALNKEVANKNDSLLRTWTIDDDLTNNGFPIHGDYHTIKCSNVKNISLSNKIINDRSALIIQWEDNGATEWQIRYRLHDIATDSYIYITTKNPIDTIYDLSLGNVYDFNVRAVCDSDQMSGWSSTQSFIVDLPYWTDVVTTQPDGYIVDADGNVTISSAEGLAWLAVVVNGLHSIEPYDFTDKTVTLEKDISLSGFRWNPIGYYSKNTALWRGFRGVFEGLQHKISELYICDANSALGLFGFVQNGQIKNTIISGKVSSILSDENESMWRSSSALGGLVGYMYGNSMITNCHSSVNVYGIGSVGSLCGEAQQLDGDASIIINCSASGSVTGREACGGLIGEVYGVIVKNCYATGDVYEANHNWHSEYKGGLIGNFKFSSAYNCFSIGEIEYDETSSWVGKVIGCPYENPHIQYLYGQIDSNKELELIGNYCEDITDTAQFVHNGNKNSLTLPISINGTTHTDLIDALNAWVKKQNNPTFRTWVTDSITGYPVFGEHFVPSCYNPTNLSIANATLIGDSIIRTQLSWQQEGEPIAWEILYVDTEQKVENGTIIKVNTNPCILSNIPVGRPLDFYVRAICSDEDISSWSEPITYIPDKLRWTEVVTSQPEGYKEDEYGNIYISSAEGLAWLSSKANGLNGQEKNSLNGQRIYLMNDIDLSQYRWVPIGTSFQFPIHSINLYGNNHSINGLYVNELSGYLGLFGVAYYLEVSNLILNNYELSGYDRIGALVGNGIGINVTNCAFRGNVFGISHLGGVIGDWSPPSRMYNSYFIGDVSTRSDLTQINMTEGYVGGIVGTPHEGIISNCFVVTQIPNTITYSGVITGVGNFPELVSNCYYKSYPNQPEMTEGCIQINNSAFEGSGYSWSLNTPPYVNGAFHTDLVEALNAWVDANNSEGQYLHWVADTADVNGGFPIFAEEDTKHIITFCNDDGTVLQQDTLELGEMPQYRGEIPTKYSTAQYTYTFTGWSPQLDIVTGAQSYTAQYEATLNQYEVTFYNWDGTLLQSYWINYGEWPNYYNSEPWREADAQYSYTFTGWSPQLDIVTGNQSYTAQYEATLNQYEVTFYNWDGTLLESGWYYYGDYPSYTGATPTRESDAQFTYTFTGWDSELNVVTGVQSYTAQYEATLNQYEVIFYNWDGSVHYSATFNYGDWPVCSEEFGEPTRPSDAQYTYTFTGWSPQLDWVTGAQSYTAQYEATLNQYEVTFYNWDGTLLESGWYYYGDYPSYGGATPTRESDAQYTYTFTGWGDMSVVTGAQSYTAQYEATLNQYEVTFYNWDGSVHYSAIFNYGDWPVCSEEFGEPTRPSDAQYTYTFTGWDSELNVVTGNQSYTAQYEATLNQYEVTFYNWDGTLLESGWYYYGDYPSYGGATPTRESDAQYTYTFTGWSPQIDVVTGNQYYYAQYESTLNQYEVTFYNWDGSVHYSATFNYGDWPVCSEEFGEPTRPSDAQYTYTFIGWSPELDMVTDHQSYYAQYESTINQYEVTFYNWDGTLLESGWYYYGDYPSYGGATPTRESDVQFTYTFSGWDSELNVVTGAQSYTAQYEATLNQYEVTFYNWDGSVLQSTMVNYGEMPVYNSATPTRESDAQYTYTFTGWSPLFDIVTGAQSYTAQYEATLNQYEVIFYNWDGSVLQSTMVNYGEMPSYNSATPTRESDAQYTYTFNGWGDMSVVTGNQSYTAQYEATLNQYEVIFYNWDGTLLQSSMVNYGEMPVYNSATPTRESDAQYTYTFIGWSPQLDIVTGAQSYTAQYEATLNQYEVTFYNWDGTWLQSDWYYYGDYPSYTGATPTREADAQYTYTFIGWGDMSVVTGVQSYTAQYTSTLNQYEINFYDWDGTLLQSEWVNYGKMPSYNSATPTRESDAQFTYTFTGWGDMSVVTGAQSYTAQYESTLNQYEVTFYNWDGTLLYSGWDYYGDYPSYGGATPTRESDVQFTYTFSGWDSELNVVTGAQSYTAQYEATLNQYEVTFYNWNGEVLQSSMVNYGEMPSYNSAIPTRESDAQYTYTFNGWGDMSVVTGAQSYTAQYEATLNQYEVTFYNWDGSVHYSAIFNYGDWPVCSEEFGEPTRPSDAQYTYTFTGWDSELNVVTGNQSYTAQYEATLNQYEVTFYNWNGEVLQSTLVNYGEMPSYNSATPTREADAQFTYTFTGWGDMSMVTGVQSYTAQYEATLNQYEVIFYNWDGSVLQSTMVNYGEMPSYNSAIPTREADAQYTYTFIGWSPELSEVVDDQEYTAQYDAIENDPTSMDEVSAETIKPRKVLIDEKVYIIVGETIYSAQGQKIR